MERLDRVRQLYTGGRMYDALEAAQAICERYPKDADAWWILGCICRHTGMPAASDDAFRRAVAAGTERGLPFRVSSERFMARVHQIRQEIPGREEVVAEPMPTSHQIAAGVSPDARWVIDGSRLLVFQVNHENQSGSEAELDQAVRLSFEEARTTGPSRVTQARDRAEHRH